MLIASAKGGTDFEPVPAGTYAARCVSVVDLGLQDGGQWGPKRKVYIGFEIPEVRVSWKKDDKEYEGPAIIGSSYTLSISDKAILGQHLVTWRGVPFTDAERDAFDVFTVLGVPAMISVTHNKKDNKTYANISGVMRMPKGMVCPERETDLKKYSATDPSTSTDGLPEWLQKKIQAGLVLAQSPEEEYQGIPPTGDDPFDDDIPF